MAWFFTEHDGKLAVTMGWSSDWNKPIEQMHLWVHPSEKYIESYYKEFVDLRVLEGNRFQAWNTRNGNYSTMDITSWGQVHLERPIKPPGRGGKDWKWEWYMGKWHKEWK